MMWPLVSLAVPAAIGAIAWAVVSLKRLRVSNERTQQALEGCPAAHRAAVLKAAGEYSRALKDSPYSSRRLAPRGGALRR